MDWNIFFFDKYLTLTSHYSINKFLVIPDIKDDNHIIGETEEYHHLFNNKNLEKDNNVKNTYHRMFDGQIYENTNN